MSVENSPFADTPGDAEVGRKGRFSIWGLLRLQLLISPVLLGFVYVSQQHVFGRFSTPAKFLWMFGVPCAYVSLLTVDRLREHPPSSFVFGGLRRGFLYGALFAVLTWLPQLILETASWIAFDLLPRVPIDGMLVTIMRAPGTIRQDIFTYAMLMLFWLVYGSILGAASGVASGIGIELMGGKRRPDAECT